MCYYDAESVGSDCAKLHWFTEHDRFWEGALMLSHICKQIFSSKGRCMQTMATVLSCGLCRLMGNNCPRMRCSWLDGVKAPCVSNCFICGNPFPWVLGNPFFFFSPYHTYLCDKISFSCIHCISWTFFSLSREYPFFSFSQLPKETLLHSFGRFSLIFCR